MQTPEHNQTPEQNQTPVKNKKLELAANLSGIPVIIAILLAFIPVFIFDKGGTQSKISLSAVVVGQQVLDKAYTINFSWFFLVLEIALIVGVLVASLSSTKSTSKNTKLILVGVGSLIDIACGVCFFLFKDLFLKFASAKELIADINNGIVKFSVSPVVYVQGGLIILGGLAMMVTSYVVIKASNNQPVNQ